ncbi:MAG: hypothetical protein A3K19_25895 [Lentisphaerae bacterium RIFOXYB12_FULL_65_16]|nr:MAG: hypothetical protein A3K18_31895 [Lentisphaerae bacterium RIFOXYA12_64_32]OGV91404.1 MAG: hypothetical protein A3K19_25895 [Lentisphaerae bacterium RIFOXYB12_FULL_65_16]
MKNLKIVLLGAGSRYFEYVVGELAITPELAGSTIVMYDIDRPRMDLIYRACKRTIAKTKCGIKLSATMDLSKALDGANFAISSIGVHGPDASWHKLDSEVCARFGIIHTTGDSVGPSGISQGLRIIPIYVNIAQAMRKYCPDIILLNHSNPMNPICRAIIKATGINTVGYCHNVAHDISRFAKLLNLPVNELEVTVAGPNHMNWLLAIRHQGQDVYPKLKQVILNMKPEHGMIFAREVLQLLDIFPVGGDRHMLEFYPHARQATKPEELRYGLKWRAATIEAHHLAREISHEPDELVLRAKGQKEPWIPTGKSPESMGEQIRAMAFSREKIHYVNTPNRGAVTNLPDWAVIELKAVVGSHGARPLFVGPLPPQAVRWSLPTVYAHELMVDAAIEGSREKALMALACDPMMTNFGEVEPLFDAMVEAQGQRLTTFRKAGARPRRSPVAR